jgi:hypothetical protein
MDYPFVNIAALASIFFAVCSFPTVQLKTEHYYPLFSEITK